MVSITDPLVAVIGSLLLIAIYLITIASIRAIRNKFTDLEAVSLSLTAWGLSVLATALAYWYCFTMI